MKTLFYLLILFLLVSCEPEGSKTYVYSGVVVDKIYDSPSGYKSYSDPTYGIMMKEDSSHQVIRVKDKIRMINSDMNVALILSTMRIYSERNRS